MTAFSTAPDQPRSPIKVTVQKTGRRFRLLRGGEPYAVRGAGMVVDDIERFAAAGGNSIRTWGTTQHGQDTQALLDKAYAHGVTVALGLEMGTERHGFDYDDREAVAAQLAFLRNEVMTYRNSPALLVWLIGNELDHDYANPRVYDAVNDVARMIRELDPCHPTTTTTSGFRPEVNREILSRAPSLDFIAFQLYGSLFELPERLTDTGFDGPFMVTEWGTIGYWEAETTAWGAPVELNSTAKADTFLRAHREVLTPLADQLIGDYAFFWGQKQERTPTWFGALTEGGKVTQVVDALQYAWTGEWPAIRTPRVERMLLDGKTAQDNVRLAPGQTVEAVIDVHDPKGGSLIYRWELKPESAATSGGGDYEAPLPNLAGVLSNAGAASACLKAPAPGKYRLFAYATNDSGRVAHANVPFLVEGAGQP